MAEQIDKQRREDHASRGSQLTSVQVMFAVILAVGLLLAINFSSRIIAGQPLQEAYNQARDEVEQLRAEQAELITQLDYVRSDPYVERWARSEGKMVREGEMLVVPVPSGVVPEVEPVVVEEVPVQTAPPEPESWTLWWALFFDVDPPDFTAQP
jgi:cell division protein FtsB